MPCEKIVEKNGVQNTFGKATSCQKGKFLKYDKLELTDYLLPNWEITVEEKHAMFAIRTEINDFPGNCGKIVKWNVNNFLVVNTCYPKPLGFSYHCVTCLSTVMTV